MLPGWSRRSILRSTGGGVALAAAYGGLPLAAGTFKGGTGEGFDNFFLESVRADPNRALLLGVRDADGGTPPGWTVKDDDWHDRQVDIAARGLAFLEAHPDHGTSTDRALFAKIMNDARHASQWRSLTYPFYAGSDPLVEAQSLLIGFQPLESLADAEAYAARIEAMPGFILAQITLLEERAAGGAAIPHFNIPIILAGLDKALSEIAVKGGAGLPIRPDFATRAMAAGIEPARIEALRRTIDGTIEGPLRAALGEARTRLVAYGETFRASNGIHALPRGEEFYRYLIRFHADVVDRPEEIHAFGLSEVERLRGAIARLGPALGCGEDCGSVLRFLATDPRFFYPATRAGRDRYLAEARECLARAEAIVPQLVTLPLRAEIELRETDLVSAPTAGRAFYVEPSLESGIGIFQLNTFAMDDYPVHQLPAIVHHEAIPGHHLQAAVVAGEDRPLFRRQLYINSFAEGWGLYAERLAGEFGLYDTPEAEAGALGLELFRAVRLVLDTGIHHYGWHFERALDYMNANTANAPGDNLVEVRRYMNWPGQALGYSLGMRTIIELREEAARALGEAFDLRAFHNTVLAEGSVDRATLEQRVRRHIQSTKDSVRGSGA